MSVEIRPATEADWPRIWPIVEAVVGAGDTYAYPLDLTNDAAKALWLQQPPGQPVVAVDAGEVLGTAKMGPNRPGNGDHIGTASFMVGPAARGRGVGRLLGEYVVRWHRERGFHGIQFNAVVEANTAADAPAVVSRRSKRSRSLTGRRPSRTSSATSVRPAARPRRSTCGRRGGSRSSDPPRGRGEW
ncbi:GNAT family N-acetyltransferase [Calidifontibacter sp. DB0510]|uniref:GNAT family N-acetyltransferase n=1 Tax=Metallococcus carri TaxID=1656884 RepID=A0A967B797_9MICO|nr:GNAT family N-acetyltransferase [Metallococcus carri]NOP37622.1 GNAT family N-acetyltransferase [Calidifontibacter sp. DB2511S]